MRTECAITRPGPAMLSRLSLSNPEVARTMADELRRCKTDADLATWAKTWGEPMCHELDV